MTIRVLLADDDTLFREGMASLLGQCAGVEVVGQAKDAHEAVRRATLLRPEVVLMDIGMPGGGGVAATRELLTERPEQVVCMLTGSEQATDLFAAIRAGARGYLVKTVAIDELHRSLVVLVQGGAVVPPPLAARLLEEFGRLVSFARTGPSDLDKLTTRECQVLERVAHGASNQDIGDELVIAENTVKVHLRNILEKLALRNRQQAAAFAVQQGLAHDIRPERP